MAEGRPAAQGGTVRSEQGEGFVAVCGARHEDLRGIRPDHDRPRAGGVGDQPSRLGQRLVWPARRSHGCRAVEDDRHRPSRPRDAEQRVSEAEREQGHCEELEEEQEVDPREHPLQAGGPVGRDLLPQEQRGHGLLPLPSAEEVQGEHRQPGGAPRPRPRQEEAHRPHPARQVSAASTGAASLRNRK